VSWLLADRADTDVVWQPPGGPPRTVGALRAAVAALRWHGVPPGGVVSIDVSEPWAGLVGVLGAISAGRVALPSTRAVAGASVPAHPDACLLLQTSGSSGAPRRVMLSAAGIAANVSAILGYLPLRAGQRLGVVTPLHYSYGLIGQHLVSLRAGAITVPLTPGPWAARQLDELEGCVGVSGVPSTLAAWSRPGLPRPRLSWLASAGAPLGAARVRAIAAAFPGATLFNQYGMTEAGPRLCAGPVSPSSPAGLVGPPVAGTEIAVVGPDGTPLPAGEEGEIVARTPSAMLGYWQEPAATAAVLSEGWLSTGDRGRLDGAGRLCVLGRRDDLVQVGGERVSLVGVEQALLEHPQIDAAGVCPEPDDPMGRLRAVVVSAGLDRRALVRWMRGLPPAWRPIRVLCVSALPVRPSGKLDRRALAAIHGGEP